MSKFYIAPGRAGLGIPLKDIYWVSNKGTKHHLHVAPDGDEVRLYSGDESYPCDDFCDGLRLLARAVEYTEEYEAASKSDTRFQLNPDDRERHSDYAPASFVLHLFEDGKGMTFDEVVQAVYEDDSDASLPEADRTTVPEVLEDLAQCVNHGLLCFERKER